MHVFNRLLKRTSGDDAGAIVKSLIQLRFVVLTTATLLMVLANAYHARLGSGAGMAAIVIAVAAWSAFVLTSGSGARGSALRRGNTAAIREMAIDFLWVLGLVVLSGRSANPFIYYYLVLVAISASIFSTRSAWAFCLTGITIYSALLIVDIGAHFDHMAERYREHLAGMWLNYVGSSLVTCYFVSRLANMIRVQQTQLAAAREENLKNEQLIGIGTVAASTVHSLATPLSTLTVLAEDMATADTIEPRLREDLALMVMQINRCKQTMKDLATLAQGWSADGVLSVADLQFELEEYYALNKPSQVPSFRILGDIEHYHLNANLLLQHALINLINNAVESEGAPAEVSFTNEGRLLHIAIRNSTDMAPDDILQRWGNPVSSHKQAGLGIGSFLANSTIEKLGGTVRLQAEEGHGQAGRTQILVTVALPLEGPL